MESKNLTCDEHGKVEGYIACTHIVFQGALVDHHISPSDKRGLGELICSIPINKHKIKDYIVICRPCLQKVVKGRFTLP